MGKRGGRRRGDDSSSDAEDHSTAAPGPKSKAGGKGSRRGHNHGSSGAGAGSSAGAGAGGRHEAKAAHDSTSTSADNSSKHGGYGNTGKKGLFGTGDIKHMQCVALKTFHGRHIRVDPSGEMKASSSNVGDAEKFEVVCNEDGTISLRSCHGKFVSVDKGAQIRACQGTIGDSEKFKVTLHEEGLISLEGPTGYIAAEAKNGLRANRAMVGTWEKFQVKDRSRKCPSTGNSNGASSVAEEAGDEGPPFFDACCNLQQILAAEEQYSSTHSDKIATTFGKRARARRDQGLEWCFSHFRSEQDYSKAFSGCIASWDATSVRLRSDNEEPTSVVGRSRARSGSSTFSNADDQGSVSEDRAWEYILEKEAGVCLNADIGPVVHAAFGIPPVSAAEADDAAFERLASLCQHPRCVAVGPCGLNFPASSEPVEVRDNHKNLRAAEILAKFGTAPNGIYEARRDPQCQTWLAAAPGSKVEDWTVRHGDRRSAEFSGACMDYETRRERAQITVLEKQVELAKETGLVLIIQIPAQEDAERHLAEVLVNKLGGPGTAHPVLLSSFHGRPKCAAALLQHFPNLCIGFSGLLTHSKLKDILGEVAFDVPLDRFVLESLGPRYPPAGVGDGRGSFSHPGHITCVSKELAKVKRMDESDILQRAFENTGKLFGFPKKSNPTSNIEATTPCSVAVSVSASAGTADPASKDLPDTESQEFEVRAQKEEEEEEEEDEEEDAEEDAKSES